MVLDSLQVRSPGVASEVLRRRMHQGQHQDPVISSQSCFPGPHSTYKEGVSSTEDHLKSEVSPQITCLFNKCFLETYYNTIIPSIRLIRVKMTNHTVILEGQTVRCSPQVYIPVPTQDRHRGPKTIQPAQRNMHGF